MHNMDSIKYSVLVYIFKWIVICSIIGALIGSASAFFLVSLSWATDWREAHKWIILFLPLAGLVIGLSYHYLGNSVVKGNNLIIDEFHKPNRIIPFKMAPLVLIGTIITHFFGGSAGREGTAIQMGGAIADQFSRFFKLKSEERKIILIIGISAGFASVFGTPLAGAIFALEVLVIGRMRYDAIFPSFLVAIIASIICNMWGVEHTHYLMKSLKSHFTVSCGRCWQVLFLDLYHIYSQRVYIS